MGIAIPDSGGHGMQPRPPRWDFHKADWAAEFRRVVDRESPQ